MRIMRISPSKILNFYYPMDREIPQEILEKAGNRGTYLHSKIENFFNDESEVKTFDFDEKDREIIEIQWNNFISQIDKTKFINYIQELEIVTDKMSGYIDFLGVYDDVPSIIDWKTNSVLGAKEIEKYTLQLNLYRYMIKLVYKNNFDSMYIVHLTKNKSRNRLKFIKCDLIEDEVLENKINEVYKYYNNEENYAN